MAKERLVIAYDFAVITKTPTVFTQKSPRKHKKNIVNQNEPN